MLSMLSVLSIPASILTCILTEWLEMTDVVQLDTATCSQNDRSVLLELFRSSEFVLKSGKILNPISCYHRVYDWLIMREMKIDSFVYTFSRDARLQSSRIRDLFRIIGGPALRNIDLTNANGFSDVLTGIDATCHRLLRIRIWFDRPIAWFAKVSNIFVQSRSCLQSLDIGDCRNNALEIPTDLVFPALRNLSLTGFRRAENCSTLLKACPHLTHLRYANGDMQRFFAPLRTEFLQHLCIEKWTWVANEELCSLATRCPELRTLCLENCTDQGAAEIKDATVVAAFAQHCPHLEAVKIVIEGETGAETVMALAQHVSPRLRHLYIELTGDQHVQEVREALSVLSRRCCNLQSLRLFDIYGNLRNEMVPFIQAQPNLTHLDLSNCRVDSAMWDAIARLGPSLVLNLNSSWIYDETFERFQSMVERCTSLRQLRVRSVQEFEYFHISALTKRLWKLRTPPLELVEDTDLTYWTELSACF